VYGREFYLLNAKVLRKGYHRLHVVKIQSREEIVDAYLYFRRSFTKQLNRFDGGLKGPLPPKIFVNAGIGAVQGNGNRGDAGIAQFYRALLID